MTSDIPKRIKLVVNKGQDLQLLHPSKIIRNQPVKWRVLFLGVVEKMATAKVESDTGNPEWLCEITVTCKNSEDPISMLVTDSKGRHIGQVIIPLISVPPKTMSDSSPNGRPPLLLSNLYKSELEPTKKNSHPKGFLYYWMWAEEYWKLEEINKLKIKKSLSRSMHNLSNSTLNLFRRKKSTSSYQESQKEGSNGNPFDNYPESGTKASPVKINHLKNLHQKSGSNSSSSTYNSQNPFNSSTLPNSPNVNDYHSKNPFDSSSATMDISNENNNEQNERAHKISLSHQTSVCSKESPVSNKKRHGLFSKFRAKKSQSSVDLNKMASENETTTKYLLPQSLGKQQGMRLFEKKSEMSKSSADLTSWFCGDAPVPENRIRKSDGDSKMNRPHSFLFPSHNEYNGMGGQTPSYNQSESNGDHRNSYNPANLGRHCSFNLTPNPSNNIASNKYDERSNRELIDIILSLENDLKVSVDKMRLTESENLKLQKEKKALQEDLSSVRDELSKLKFKLLEAGDTKYLEKSNEIKEMASWRANFKF